MSDYRAIRRELDRMEQSLKNMDASAIQRATEEIRRGIERFAEPQKRIAELERHNELLREAVRQAREFENWILTSAERDHLQNMHDAIEAAIDAGALGEE